MGVLALYRHGSSITGDQIDGSDVDIVAVMEPGDDRDTICREVIRSGVLDRWNSERVEVWAIAVDDLDPIWTSTLIGAELVDGNRLDLELPAPEDWAGAAFAEAGACIAVADDPIKAALHAAAGRAVVAGAPVPTTGKTTWPDLYRAHVGGPWCDALNRIRDERRAPSDEVRELANWFLDAADNDEHNHRIHQAINLISTRTPAENLAADPRGARFKLIHDALTAEECDRAIALDHQEPRPRRIQAGQASPDAITITARCGDEASFWLTERMADLIVDTNRHLWRYDLTQCPVATVQRYDTGARMGWHLDFYPGAPFLRLFAVVMLSDPGVDFTGGQLQIHHTDEPESVPLRRGTMIVAPTWLLHRVTRVKTGTRWIAWQQAHGRPMR